MIDIIDSRDTQFTVDTYQIFTLEHEHEHENNYIHESNSKLTKEQGLPEFDDVRLHWWLYRLWVWYGRISARLIACKYRVHKELDSGNSK